MSKKSIDHREALLQSYAANPMQAVEDVLELAREANELEDRVKELERENSFLSDQAIGFEAHTHDLTAKLEKRTNQLLLLVDKYADIVSCKYCPLNKECSADDQIDADPILCGILITEWLEKATKEAGE